MSDWKLLNTTNASSSASVEFTSVTGYKIFKWAFTNVHASNTTVDLQIAFSTDGGSSYGVTKTTTFFRAAHKQNGTNAFSYQTGHDLAQSTSAQHISRDIGTDADHNICGEIFLFNPASTTYTKHFYGRSTAAHSVDLFIYDSYFGGYANTTSAINACKFTLSAGTIDAGIFKQYGLVST